MSTLNLYHKEVGFPPSIYRPSQKTILRYTRHAKYEAEREGVALAQLPTQLPSYDLIEVGMMGSFLTKWVVRTKLDSHRDLVLVITHDYFVKTVWTNSVEDKHSTLDRGRYTKPSLMEAA